MYNKLNRYKSKTPKNVLWLVSAVSISTRINKYNIYFLLSYSDLFRNVENRESKKYKQI